MTLGERLLTARQHARLSQKELETKSGVSQKTISKIERGDQDGSTQVVQLARALGVSAEWLAAESGDMVASAGSRAEQQRAAYATLSEAALEIAREWERLTPVCQDHVRQQIALLREAAIDTSGRRRAVKHDVRIKGDALQQGARSKRGKSVR